MRYHADYLDDYLCDKGKLRDPDFFTNQVGNGSQRRAVPTWTVCGPYIRQGLRTGDVVFFVPAKIVWKEASLDRYICTGLLVVDNVVRDDKALLAEHPELTKDFKRLYTSDLKNHLKRDRPLTKRVRPTHIILGNATDSVWFGRNSLNLLDVFKVLRLNATLSAFEHNHRRISLNHEDTEALKGFLLAKLEPKKVSAHNHQNYSESRPSLCDCVR